MIIGLTGTLGAGKTEVARILESKGFTRFSARDIITDELVKIGLEPNRDNLVNMGNQLREKNSPSYLAEKMFEKAQQKGGDCVLESLRALGEVDALRKKGNFILVSVDADPEIRYRRIYSRKSETDKISFEQFLKDEYREMDSDDPNKQNLRACIDKADVGILNNWTLEELENEINNILSEFRNSLERVGKRKDYLSWDDYFMGIALMASKRSKDPSTQVGACIVDEHNVIVGTGYNGFPIGCSDDVLPWSREGSTLDVKYTYVCHAELNAILNSSKKSLRGCKIYVPLFPCNECAKAIIQSGIKEVIYLSDKYSNLDSFKASKIMFNQSGVSFRELKPESKTIVIDFSPDRV